LCDFGWSPLFVFVDYKGEALFLFFFLFGIFVEKKRVEVERSFVLFSPFCLGMFREKANCWQQQRREMALMIISSV
jgi:hypothetical protein